MLPVPLIFTSGAASGVNCYAAVLLLGLIGQFVVGKIPILDSLWDIVHTAIRPVVGGAIGAQWDTYRRSRAPVGQLEHLID